MDRFAEKSALRLQCKPTWCLRSQILRVRLGHGVGVGLGAKLGRRNPMPWERTANGIEEELWMASAFNAGGFKQQPDGHDGAWKLV